MILNKKEKKAVKTFVYNCQGEMTNKSKELIIKKSKSDSSLVVGIINSLFQNPGYLQVAWRIVGFPFATLNRLYKKIKGEDHPVFIEGFSENNYNF